MKEELVKGLTKEQIAKLKACKSSEEVLKAAKEEGIELSDEQLEAVSGGNCSPAGNCPFCGSDEVEYSPGCWEHGDALYHCMKCRKYYTKDGNGNIKETR